MSEREDTRDWALWEVEMTENVPFRKRLPEIERENKMRRAFEEDQ